MRCSLTAILWSLLLAVPCAGRQPPGPKTVPVLPGVTAEGAILQHNQWSLRPAGKHLELGDFPVNAALHPAGHWLAVLHAGYGTHEVVIVDLDAGRQKIVSRVTLPQTFQGLCFAPDGSRLFASGGEFDVVHAFDFKDGYLSNRQRLPV